MSEADFTVEALADFTYEIMAPSFIEGQEKPNYLYFHKGDRLKVLVTYENGWYYGSIEEEFEEKKVSL